MNCYCTYGITFAPETASMYSIKVNFEQAGQLPLTLENMECGQSLLEICLKHGIALRHDCGGVCACSTCHLYVNVGENALEEVSRREKDFIKRAVSPQLDSRLGCQCILVENGEQVNLEITIPDQAKVLIAAGNKRK